MRIIFFMTLSVVFMPFIFAEAASNDSRNQRFIKFFQSLPKTSLKQVVGFNQRDRDEWIKSKINTIPKGSVVLDIGAGTCPYRNLFLNCNYITQDFKKYYGEKLGGVNQYGSIDIVSDASNIPLEDNFCDIILCTEVLEHVPRPMDILQEIARILRPGGRAFITAPLGSGLHQLPYHFYGGFTPEWYKFFCEENNLKILEILPNGGFFKLLSQECFRASGYCKDEKLFAKEIEQLLTNYLPRFFFDMERRKFIEQFTVGYHVEVIKQ